MPRTDQTKLTIDNYDSLFWLLSKMSLKIAWGRKGEPMVMIGGHHRRELKPSDAEWIAKMRKNVNLYIANRPPFWCR